MMESLLASFAETLRALTLWFESEEIPYVTIGGLAVSLLGRPRVTQDIDMVVLPGERPLESLVQSGKAYGFEGRINDVAEFAKRSRVILVRHAESGISVDISCGALPFEQEMIERALTVQAGGVRLKVLTPEDLVVMKVVAGRAKDLIDVESLLGARKDLDLARIRRWAGEFASALERPEITDSLERLLAHRSQE